MSSSYQFSEIEQNYFAYQARQDFIRQQNVPRRLGVDREFGI